MAEFKRIICFIFLLITRVALASLRRDLRILARILPGEYSNLKQYHNDAYLSNAVPTRERHIFFWSRYTPIKLPSLDEDTTNFYVEHFMDKSIKPSQQKIYSFLLDPVQNSVRMEVYKLEGIGDIRNSRAARFQLHNMTSAELYSNRECDMFWRRLGMRTFAAATGPQCVANMKGEKVRILVSIVLTPTYINAQEGWYRVSDGSKITAIGVPYKLMKIKKIKQKLLAPTPRVTSSRGRRSRLHFGRSRKFQKDSPKLSNLYIGPWELRDLVSLAGALMSGHSVRYTVNLTNCFLVSGTTMDRLSFGDYVDTFEIFQDGKKKEITRLEFSHHKLIHSETGFVSIIKEVVVYSNSSVYVTVTYLQPPQSHIRKQGKWFCQLYDVIQRDGNLKFITEPHKDVIPIKRFTSLLSLLRKGRLVRMSVDYTTCAGARTKAISGGEITDYDVMESEKMIEVSMSRRLTYFRNYPRYVLNFVTFIFNNDGQVFVKATTMDASTYTPYTASKMYCNFGDADQAGSVKLFYQ
ncbi:uncharacterized protein LOC115220992 isoform X2 [Octopus sinensis]|uniref:Uncharacterized protein LOC115220992 isoform X2 n=1 Tax=Octopus sinensis TaxID=2607531 RepID=A0A7E6FFK0_9MOLL|nr:uncharacterized protein LOC115220992 isoform X2 [Octopus sinensis]